jgi:hypothetical protein
MAQTPQYLNRASVPTPPSGFWSAFYDLDNKSVLTLKDWTGAYTPLNKLPGPYDTSKLDDCLCEVVDQIVDDAGCALKNTSIDGTAYQSIINNLNYYSEVLVDPSTGGYSSSITSNPTLFVALVLNNVTCNGDSDGTAAATVTGGVGPYTLIWQDLGGGAANPAALSAGSYTLTVTDANGTVKVNTFVITEPPALVITNVPVQGTSPNATATALSAGGVPPYAYNWKDNLGVPIGQTSQTATSLSSGTYQIEVTDANGCTVEDTNVVIP